MDANPLSKTILFWMFIVLLAVVLFRMVSANRQPVAEEEPSYSDFMTQVQKDNVREVTIYASPNTYDVVGEWREPSKKFRATVIKESAAEIIKELGDHGVLINVREQTRADWVSFLLTGAPIFLLVGFWIIMMRQMKTARKP
jgi:cell division protease FtsH